MPLTAKSIDDVQQDLATFIDQYNIAHGTNYDSRQGTVLRDLLIDAPSIQFNALSNDLVSASQVFSLVYASTMNSIDLENLASNYSITKNPATKADGTQEFLTTNDVTTDIVINAGVIVSTQASASTSEIQFQTTQTVTLPASQKNNFKIVENGITKYRITAPIVAVVAGSAGNVASLTILNLKQPVAGITVTRNSIATTGGTDNESNTALATRIKNKLQGNNVGTESGINSLMLTDSNVSAVSVVRPGDPELVRNEFGGSVDVYLKGQNTATFEENIKFFSASPTVILSTQPAKSIISVIGTSGGITKTFLQGTDYVFSSDPVTLFTGSTKVKNGILFDIGGTNPDDGSMLDITYTYDKLITDAQSKLDSAANNLITADILAREAVLASISITATITIFPGNTRSTVIQNVETALSTFINTLALGSTFSRSQIITAIDLVSGVDVVNTDTLLIQKNGITITDQTISVKKFEYTQLSSVNIFVST